MTPPPHACTDVAPCTKLVSKPLKLLAKKAGVRGVIVHAHAFRHTLVGRLADAGDSLDVISKFIGHKSAAVTTKYYWTVSVQELHEKMNNPFAGGKKPQRERGASAETDAREELKLANAKTRKCLEIINHYNVIIGAVVEKNGGAAAVQDAILETMPGLEGLLKLLAATDGDCGDVDARASSAMRLTSVELPHRSPPMTPTKLT